MDDKEFLFIDVAKLMENADKTISHESTNPLLFHDLPKKYEIRDARGKIVHKGEFKSDV